MERGWDQAGGSGSPIFTCFICKLAILRGKTLSCLHTFCHHCIQNYYISNKLTDRVVCPVNTCSQTTPLPSQIAADLKDFDEGELVSSMGKMGFGNESIVPSINVVPPTPCTPPGNSVVMRRKSTQKTAGKEYKSTLQAPHEIEDIRRMRAVLRRGISVPDQTVPPPFDHSELSSASNQHQPVQRARSEPQKSYWDSPVRDNRRAYKSVLTTNEEKAALVKVRARLQRTPNVDVPARAPASRYDYSRQRPKSTSGVIPPHEDHSPHYHSLLTTGEQKEAFEKIKARLQYSHSHEHPQVLQEDSGHQQQRSKGFRTRKSKPPVVADDSAKNNIVQGGFGFFLMAARKCESEKRDRSEGPWGYQTRNHWDGRSWGEADD